MTVDASRAGEREGSAEMREENSAASCCARWVFPEQGRPEIRMSWDEINFCCLVGLSRADSLALLRELQSVVGCWKWLRSSGDAGGKHLEVESLLERSYTTHTVSRL